MNKNSYRHKKYDTTIMQTVTVGNIIEVLILGFKYKNLKEVVNFLTEQRTKALLKCDRRRTTSTDRKIKRLKELGFTIPKEVEDGLNI
jgi:hypothetical protein|tara:strand:- start:61 stop:324 length:264 start_codon:yes stop_codon:yes gene_type:complete